MVGGPVVPYLGGTLGGFPKIGKPLAGLRRHRHACATSASYGEDSMRPRVKFGGLAAAAISALTGLSLIGLVPAASSAVTVPAKPYDFNGDGFADLAIGSPFGTVGTQKY